MTTDLNKVLEKDANGRLIDLYNIIQNENITKAEGANLKSLFETELRAMKEVSDHLDSSHMTFVLQKRIVPGLLRSFWIFF